jgi:hypothetical protein
MSERTTTLMASPAAVAAATARPARTMPTTITLPSRPPPPVRDAKGRLNLDAGALKVTLVLDAAQLAEVTLPDGAGPQKFRITVGERRVTGRLNAKGLRKATALIAEHGVEKVAVIVQGKLEAGDEITEAGLMATVKGPRPGPGEQNSPEKSDTA